jgi:fructose-1,6-bisphosphatase/inositol monophosphatase family enzyme
MFEAVGEVLREVSAAVVMPRFAALATGEIAMKAANDPVTIADREAEVRIADALSALLPAARIVGEEACASNPALLDRLGEGMVWIVDPIDGTANFAAGRAPFAGAGGPPAGGAHGSTASAFALPSRFRRCPR